MEATFVRKLSTNEIREWLSRRMRQFIHFFYQRKPLLMNSLSLTLLSPPPPTSNSRLPRHVETGLEKVRGKEGMLREIWLVSELTWPLSLVRLRSLQIFPTKKFFDSLTVTINRSNNISYIFSQQECLCMVLEFLPGRDREKLIMRCGKLEERAVRYVWCTNYFIWLQKIYSDPDEFDVILINVGMFPRSLSRTYLFVIIKLGPLFVFRLRLDDCFCLLLESR